VLGSTLVVAGGLLLTGASAGALLRRSGHVLRAAGSSARRSVGRANTPVPAGGGEEAWPTAEVRQLLTTQPPVDAEEAFPDVVSDHETAAPPPLLVDRETTEEVISLFEAPPADRSAYRLPDRSLLQKSKPATGSSAEAGARVAEVLVQTLAHFTIDATVVGQISGPRVTRYELQLAPGTKVSKVAALKDDLSYALATTEIRILAPIPGKQAVGVEVPNLAPNLVTLGDIYDDLPATASPLAVWLGKDISGTAVWADLARMPHLLIAGTTGSGKSGCINTILTSVLLRSTPDEVRLILIDPKRIELSYYESIPHLLTPVVSSPKEASAVLTNVVAEMERRYERLSSVRARSLPEANRSLRRRGEEPMPHLLVVIDELADLMMVSPQAVEDAVIRLAQKSRAVGVHLVLATQRPSVDVITGMIKANVPSRIAFAVSSQTDSRVILDQSGAESLLGQGDMLFKPLGTSRLQRVQGAYVSEEEVALIVEQCRHQREQELDESLLELPEVFAEGADGEGEGDGDFDPDEDPLLDRAIEIVVQTQTASVSLLQRRLRVGYTRAGRLVDMLERRGIISGYEGSKPRRVLVGEADLERVLSAP
jgi:S-DNA-T family DNA segregation ATPase FtsK/SpoIIIE